MYNTFHAHSRGFDPSKAKFLPILSNFYQFQLFLSALCNTMPIPCGMFMPIFIVGAALGRFVGEIVSTIWPEGMDGGTDQPIYPGVYAVIGKRSFQNWALQLFLGAAAFSGAVTHSVSVVVICCEITGQIIYIIPLMVCCLLKNGSIFAEILDCCDNFKCGLDLFSTLYLWLYYSNQTLALFTRHSAFEFYVRLVKTF